MSEVAIQLINVSKSYKRFTKPFWRAVDALSIPVPDSKYDVFYALKNLSFEINKGEIVALIGRNGAGKSTALRLICGQTRPDNGKIKINGKIQALMELGTGFHPDFNALENIRSALGYQGRHSSEIPKYIEEIIEFSELESFIYRPLREYSAGMYARLAFAVATSIEPEILIVDEILGAGDAYFMGKSIQRMKSLTENGCTVLFVSHDMSAVQMLCKRGIWIENGIVRKDGDILNVGKSYLMSVRADEERRAKERTSLLTSCSKITKAKDSYDLKIIRFTAVTSSEPISFNISSIKLCDNNGINAEIAIEPSENINRLILDAKNGSWGKTSLVENKHSISCTSEGDSLLHAPLQVLTDDYENSTWLSIEYSNLKSDNVVVELFDSAKSKYVRIGQICRNSELGQWETAKLAINLNNASTNLADNAKSSTLKSYDNYGSKQLVILDFAFIDNKGLKRHTLISGDDCKITINFASSVEIVNPVCVVAIYRPDSTCALQVSSNINGRNIGTVIGKKTFRFDFKPLNLGPGDYIVSVAFFKELNLYNRNEPEAYDLHDRCYALKVLPPEGILFDIGTVNQKTEWILSNHD